jgi:hypothetical protein
VSEAAAQLQREGIIHYENHAAAAKGRTVQDEPAVAEKS